MRRTQDTTSIRACPVSYALELYSSCWDSLPQALDKEKWRLNSDIINLYRGPFQVSNHSIIPFVVSLGCTRSPLMSLYGLLFFGNLIVSSQTIRKLSVLIKYFSIFARYITFSFPGFRFLNVRICCPSLFFMIVNRIPLDFGLQFEEKVGSGDLWW